MTELPFKTIDEDLYKTDRERFIEWDLLINKNWRKKNSHYDDKGFVRWRSGLMENVAVICSQVLKEDNK